MAKVGNEAILILKLAAERMRQVSKLSEPRQFRDDPKLNEAYTFGLEEGIRQYRSTLDGIVAEQEERR